MNVIGGFVLAGLGLLITAFPGLLVTSAHLYPPFMPERRERPARGAARIAGLTLAVAGLVLVAAFA